ncbi:MAG: hypothetical protein JNJ99_14625 [Crocinitomicaceae bacterium]|nr:hypothetical protein [Crocinitomicaceae bacterium]
MLKSSQIARQYFYTLGSSYVLCILVAALESVSMQSNTDNLLGVALVAIIPHLALALFSLMFFILSGSGYLKNKGVQFIALWTPAVIPITLLLGTWRDVSNLGMRYDLAVVIYSSFATLAVLWWNSFRIKRLIRKILEEKNENF